MHTSHFWRFYHENDPRLVSIALKSPEWFKGREYPPLAPRLDMLPMEEAEYRLEYQAILDRLDPRQVYEHLGQEAILLCWEPPSRFCHRRLVAEWLEKALGVQVLEFPQNYDQRQKDLFKEGG
jgi:hypothetical protein